MRHVRPDDLVRLAPLLERLRAIGALKETRPGAFSCKGRAALHFHEHAGALYADLRLSGPDFERLPVGAPLADAALLRRIEEALAPAPPAPARAAPLDGDPASPMK